MDSSSYEEMFKYLVIGIKVALVVAVLAGIGVGLFIGKVML